MKFGQLFDLKEAIVEKDGQQFLINSIEDEDFIDNFTDNNPNETVTHLIGNIEETVIVVAVSMEEKTISFYESLKETGLFVLIDDQEMHNDLFDLLERAVA